MVLQPKTVDIGFTSVPPAGVELTAGERTAPTPFAATASTSSLLSVSAPESATIDGQPHGFAGWSDGKAADHSLTATHSTPDLVATYAPATTFVPIAPVRVVDTRTSAAGPLKAGITRTFAVGGTHGIPANALAVTGNLTAVNPTNSGWFELASGPA